MAGGGVGDGGPALDAQIDPRGLTWCADATGNLRLYIADGLENRVRYVDSSGAINTLAGTGQAGFSGDGGPATLAQISFPTGVACDASGNVYIADTSNSRVRKVDTTGIITTVAGTSIPGYSGDGEPAAQASLGHPRGLTVDGQNNLYIADTDNNRIRLVPLAISNPPISTVAGGGPSLVNNVPATQSLLSGPSDIALDSAGNLFIADFNDQEIRMVTPQGVISAVAGNGFTGTSLDGTAGRDAILNQPFRLAFDAVGNLLFIELGAHKVRRLNAINGSVSPDSTLTTVAGNGSLGSTGDGGPATLASLYPYGLTVKPGAGEIDIGAVPGTPLPPSTDYRVRAVSNGLIATIVGSGNGDGGPAVNALLDPRGLTVTGGSSAPADLYVADYKNSSVRLVSGVTGNVTTVGGSGTAGYSGDGGPATAAQLNGPVAVTADGQGNLYVADTNNNRVRRIDAAGTITTVAGNGVSGTSGDGGQATQAAINKPYGVALDAAGNIYIAELDGNRVRKVTPQGIITTFSGTGSGGLSGNGGPAIQASLYAPADVAIGPDGDVYIADYNNNSIRRVRPDGIIEQVAGTGWAGFSGDGGPANQAQINHPLRLLFDTQGNLYIADHINLRVREIHSSGGAIIPNTSVITSVAGICDPSVSGSCVSDTSGDGGPALAAHLYPPTGIALDASGHLFIAQSGSSRVRAVTLSSSPNPPVLTLTKSASSSAAKSGDTVTFTIQYQNTSASAANNTQITDAIPAGTTLVPGSISNGGSLSGNTITWTIGNVSGTGSAGSSGSVSFQVTVN